MIPLSLSSTFSIFVEFLDIRQDELHSLLGTTRGTLDLLILKPLALGLQRGWVISERLQQVSSEVLKVQQGSLSPALHRLERRGWIRAHWGTSENNRRADFHELTRSARRQLRAEGHAWRKLTTAVGQILEMA